MEPYSRLRQRFLKSISLYLWLAFFTVPIFAQVNNFPKDYQLYPRNLSTNKGIVNISGTLKKTSGYSAVRLKVYRDNLLLTTTNLNISYNKKGNANYSFNSEIVAELANYTFSLFGVRSGIETLIKTAGNVVAGDAYIIQGQSNAVANLRVSTTFEDNADDPSNSPNRGFVRVYGSGSATSSYTKAWFIGNGNVWFDVDGNTGQWGMRLGSNIAGSRNIPVAIFNGASPGEAISYFIRNDANPGDANTNYGRLLNRIREAGLKNNIRGLIWYQGESDVLGFLNAVQTTTQQYKAAFSGLISDWKADFPGLSKFFMFQIRYGCGMSNADNCLKIQEAQRQLDKESNEIVTISAANTTQIFDGGVLNYCHFRFVDGYKKIGDWVTPLILRDLYNVTSAPPSIESPEPVSASFSIVGADGVASQVRLALKDQSSLFTISGDISPMFRLDGGNYTISSVAVSGNNVLVNFSRAPGTTTNPASISYRGHDIGPAPVLTNSNGLALVNFEYIPISQGVTGSSAKNIGSPMEEVARVSNSMITGVSTYPNPVTQTMVINYPTDKSGQLELKIFDLYGRELSSKKVHTISGQNQFRMDVSTLKQGVYILQMRKEMQVITRRFLVGTN
ncbi:T9SS type A sorting domain-containing protein [Flavihumibacter fluvii]|uniref:T9SS type A sorting domain-containing protein n=1 Tax=Flavihumibacter fluvii TaxID=2838157 RepID=UPI001BDE7557|nr:T9SS type A sorting domain-containing protein [Flavihumibacter fluvii]ULQ50740.1 T9SS type A sorting domain-containing protein [Flavihumibacter fluvii]